MTGGIPLPVFSGPIGINNPSHILFGAANMLAGGGGRAGSVSRTFITEALGKSSGYLPALGKGIGLGNVGVGSFKPYLNPRPLTIDQRQTIAGWRSFSSAMSILLGALAGTIIVALTKSVGISITVGTVVKVVINEVLNRLEKYIFSWAGIEPTAGF